MQEVSTGTTRLHFRMSTAGKDLVLPHPTFGQVGGQELGLVLHRFQRLSEYVLVRRVKDDARGPSQVR